MSFDQLNGLKPMESQLVALNSLSEFLPTLTNDVSNSLNAVKDHLRHREELEGWFRKVIAKSGYKGSPELYSQEFRKQFELWIENLAANPPKTSNSGIVTSSGESQNYPEIFEVSITDSEDPGRMKSFVLVKPERVIGAAESLEEVNAETTDTISSTGATTLHSNEKQSKSSRDQQKQYERRFELKYCVNPDIVSSNSPSAALEPGTSKNHQNLDHPFFNDDLLSQYIPIETVVREQNSNSKKRKRATKLKFKRQGH